MRSLIKLLRGDEMIETPFIIYFIIWSFWEAGTEPINDAMKQNSSIKASQLFPRRQDTWWADLGDLSSDFRLKSPLSAFSDLHSWQWLQTNVRFYQLDILTWCKIFSFAISRRFFFNLSASHASVFLFDSRVTGAKSRCQFETSRWESKNSQAFKKPGS